MTQLDECEFYQIAHAALASYPVDVARLHFLQHSGGITFRVGTQQGDSSFLLKIHHSAGSGVSASAEATRARYSWLRAVGQSTGLVVQTPILNYQGDLLTVVANPKGQPSYLCTLQQWVEGSFPGGDFTTRQVQRIGTMMAQFHHLSSEWSALDKLKDALPVYEQSNLAQNVQTLSQGVETGLLAKHDFALIEAAAHVIADIVERVGRDRKRWGPIHGDFHHGNVLFHEEEVRLIDFDSLCLSPYALDLGTMLYHIYYQGPTVYPLLLEGYQAVHPLPVDATSWLDAFVTRAAIANLAFNITIPEEHTGPYLARNLRQLVDEFCRNLVAGRRFLSL
jgi:Ser/Thr protein kinase RdoA (MazF antagonist)